MRRIVLTVMTLALSACSSTTVTYSDSKEQVATNLTAVRDGIMVALKRLHSLRCAAGRCYAATEVDQVFDTIRARITSAIPAEAAALADGFQAVVDFEREELGNAKILSPIQPARMPPVATPLGYEARAVDAALRRIADVLDRVLAYNDLAPTLQVNSDPNQAELMIQVGNNSLTQRKATVTDKLPNVWRGVYSGTLRKSGYKDATVNLDLMSDGRTVISCKLVPQSAPQDSVCERK